MHANLGTFKTNSSRFFPINFCDTSNVTVCSIFRHWSLVFFLKNNHRSMKTLENWPSSKILFAQWIAWLNLFFFAFLSVKLSAFLTSWISLRLEFVQKSPLLMRNLPEKKWDKLPRLSRIDTTAASDEVHVFTASKIPSCLVDGQPYPHHLHFVYNISLQPNYPDWSHRAGALLMLD